MKKIILFSLILLLFSNAFAQTTLSSGDIAFVGYNTDPNGTEDHSFSWITLEDLSAGTVIYFTEEGWNANGNTWYGSTSEGHYSWTASNATPAGTIVYIYEDGSSNTLISSEGSMSGVLSGTGWNLLGGDSLFAYQSASGAKPSSPNFLSGLYGDDNFAHTAGCDEANDWFDCENCTTSGQSCATTGGGTSGLPSTLTNGTNAIALFPNPFNETDNAKYNGTLTGTKTYLASQINNRSNWVYDDNTAYNITSGQFATPNITALTTTAIVTTTVISSFDATSATMGGNVTIDGGASVTENGVVYNTTGTPTIADTKVSISTGTGSFYQSVSSLSVGTTYYVRAYAINAEGTSYGSEVSFTTDLDLLLALYWPNYEADKIEMISANGGGRQEIVSTTPMEPISIEIDVENEKVYWFSGATTSIRRANLDGSGVETFIADPGYASTLFIDRINGRLYWPNYEANKIESIKLDGTDRKDVISANEPISITVDISNSKVYWFNQLDGKIHKGGLDGTGSEIFIATPGYASTLYYEQQAKVLYWPNYEANKIESINEDGTGRQDVISATEPIAITVDVTNSKVYWFNQLNNKIQRGNLNGTLSEDFLTDPGYASTLVVPYELPSTPTVTTIAISTFDSTSATMGGEVISAGVDTVTERGMVYNTTGAPTTSDTKVSIGTGTGAFSQSVSGLTLNTTYYVRAYAINSIGTSYGSVEQFSTVNNPISEYSSGANTLPDTQFFGLQFTTSNTDPAYSMTGFTFLDNTGSNSVGAGKVYVFSSSPSGLLTPSDLPAYTDNLIGISDTWNGGVYGFSGGLNLDANTTYWVLTDTDGFEVGNDFSNPNNAIYATGSGNNYVNQLQSINYKVTGIAVAVPTLSSSSPTDGATGIATNSNITLTFDKDITFGTGNIQVIDLTDGSNSFTIDAANPGSEASISGAVLTINPSADLDDSSSYSIRIAATAIEDTSGNPYAGLTDDSTLNFDTADETDPTFNASGSTPADNASGVSVSDNIVLTFSENIALGTSGYLSIENLDDMMSSPIQFYVATDSDGATTNPSAGKIGVVDNKIYLNPTTNLAEETDFNINIQATAIDDMSGNSFAGFGGVGTYNFTTGDFTAPILSSSSPTDGATEIATSSNITLTFDENIAFGTGNIQVIDLTDGSNSFTIDAANPGSEASISGAVLTINPDSDLDDSSSYSIRVATTAIEDASGNTYTGITDDTTLNFNTVDVTDPTVTSVTVPASANYVQGENLDFTVNFSEDVIVDSTNGTPQLSITIGNTTRQATYQSGTGTNELLFRYTVLAGESDTDGILVGSLTANGGILRDGASNDATLTLNSVGTTTNILVDAVSAVLKIDPSSYTGTISLSDNLFVSVNMTPLCLNANLTFIGVEVDAASVGGGEIILGLYDGNDLIYQTESLSITGGVDETIGEIIPPGTLSLDEGKAYKIGLIYGGTNYIYLKVSNNPEHNGAAAFGNVFSYFNINTTYPGIPDPWAITSGWGFNIAFRLDGVMDWDNADCDSDGLLNAAELSAGTDPYVSDTDGDGIEDGTEVNTDSTDPLDDCDSVGGTPLPNGDCDNDMVINSEDAFPYDETEDTDTDGDGTGDNADTDDDGDGYSDVIEQVEGTDPLDENSVPIDYDQDGIPDSTDTDDDDDGTLDSEDAFPLDETEDTDTDDDGTGNNADTDDDDDGTLDTEDAFPLDETENTDTDGDGTGDNTDTDDDGDGYSDEIEQVEGTDPLDESSLPLDYDQDGIPDSMDTDDDDDGTLDSEDAFPLDETEDTDTDDDGTGNNADTDDDDDGTLDTEDAFPLDETENTDTDGDGIGDNTDTDDDGDGYSDEIEQVEGTDPLDESSLPLDYDQDGIPDSTDTDDDDDGTLDSEDAFPLNEMEVTDTDEDGTGNNADIDDDNDGNTDEKEIANGTDPLDATSFFVEEEVAPTTPSLVPAQAFTPNGDGNNDTWMIPGIENYPNNMVKVFNRWGHVVFEVQAYANDWEGFYKQRNKKLPQGSYLYVIDLGNGTAPIQGWIFINY